MYCTIVFPDGTNLDFDTKIPFVIGEELTLEIIGGEAVKKPKARHLVSKVFRVVRISREIHERWDARCAADSTHTIYLEE